MSGHCAALGMCTNCNRLGRGRPGSSQAAAPDPEEEPKLMPSRWTIQRNRSNLIWCVHVHPPVVVGR